MRARRGAVLLVALLAASGARCAAAQWTSHLQPAGRADVFLADITAVQAGLELSAPAGSNLRLALVGAAGESWRDGASGLSARAELTGRFLLDPEFRARWAPYVGGGVGARYDRVGDWRGVLSLVIGVEGPKWGGTVPFVEAGYGGGARIGVGFRKARAGQR
ncbi:MAG TPA: hypothetical protein VN677_01325 [Gemmatimonadaceae bacterium]|nr:hypothetical protein [Gemmatimonadaceae bacterium]